MNLRVAWQAVTAAPWPGVDGAPGIPEPVAYALGVIGVALALAGGRLGGHARLLAEAGVGALAGLSLALALDPATRGDGGHATLVGWAALGAVAVGWMGYRSRRIGFMVVGGVASYLMAGAFGEVLGLPVLRSTIGLIGAAVAPWTFEVAPAMWTAFIGALLVAAGAGVAPASPWTLAAAAGATGLQWMYGVKRASAGVGDPPP